jgi:hypothetical protein
MKRSLVLGTLALMAVLMGVVSASAQTVTLTAILSSGEETPALLSGAVGTAEISVDTGAREMAVSLRLFNFATGTTAGHIHVGPKGVAGPVVFNFPIPPGRTGDLTLTFRVGEAAFVPRPEIGIVTVDDAIQAVVGGNSYVNIHSTQSPAGEIRGQLTVRQ